jgi:hypothetical protein
MRYRTPRMRDRRVTTLLRGLLFSPTSARLRHRDGQTSVGDEAELEMALTVRYRMRKT